MRRISDTDIVVTSDDRIPASAQPEARPKARRVNPDARKAGEAKPARPKRRMRLPKFAFTPLQKMAAGGVAITALVVGGAVVWHSGIIQRTTQTAIAAVMLATADAGFRLTDITVAGRGRTGMDQVAIALGARHGDPILGVSLGQVKDRLEAIASVKTAAVERHLPGALHITLTERQPIAVWQNNGGHILVDKDGHQIPGSVAGFEHLPLVVGDGAGPRADEVLTMLSAEPDMAARVKAIVRVGNRRWNLMLDDVKDGLEVRLPEENADAAWKRFAELERTQSFAGRNVRMVDLRTSDRLILKTERPPAPAGDAPKRKDNGA
ncbi:cell division protein FtsQ/DivIB [Magnetospirillum moscoviense]|uniref:Cell division protein FtsQ n=1 Tax=Magnetospirillum moscoviense TaxID=1437059 RepID=A0A178M6S0_9PROT|nr:cell division protein FtsQ/DivIB [Magnetospirillum moscoviense]OAN44460.1 cell division protein [Magnetospirillum moscoviense]